jgi:membrane fusion protein (multidrug efflux system)
MIMRSLSPQDRAGTMEVRAWTRSAAAARRLTAPTLIACLLLVSCARKQGGPGGFQMPPMPVEVASAQPQTVRDEFKALGSIESDEIVSVVSELNAVVRRIPFTEGQPVPRGALLAQLDDREIRAVAERAEAQREQAVSNAQRSEKLFEQNLIAEQQRDDARTALKVAQANEAEAKARLSKTRIVAPFGGMVGRRRVSPGAYLQSGDVITEIARVDEMKVTFSIPERFIGDLERGARVNVATPAWPDQLFEGRVSVVDPIIDPDTRTVQVVARIGNPGRKLRPGMSGNVTVTFAERTKALMVPDEAVFAEGNQSFVYVVKPDSTVTRTAISTGTRDSAKVEVLRGLEPGAMVVRAGHQKLFEGAKVMPVASISAAEASAAAGGGPGTAGAAPAAASAEKRSAAKPAGGKSGDGH